MSKTVDRRPDYFIRTGSMFENPHGVPRDEILRYIVTNPPELVAQVVFGKYVESSGIVFTGESVNMMVDRSLPVVMGESYIDRKALERHKAQQLYYKSRYRNPFHTGVDFARQTDYTVISTIDTSILPARLVYWRRMNRVPWETIYGEVGRACWFWGGEVLCDGTGPGGDVVMDALWSRAYCGEHHRTVLNGSRCLENGQPMKCEPARYLRLSMCGDYDFGSGQGMAKRELIEHHRNVLQTGYSPAYEREFGHLRIPPIPQIEEEHAGYIWDDKRLSTDCLMSLALATWSGLENPVGDVMVGSPFGA